jgi:HlyD family secretion protein
MTQQTPLFRQEALDKQAQPEGLGERITVVRSRDALGLGALALLALGGLLWSIFGGVRVTASGQGILLRSGAVQWVARPDASGVPRAERILATLDPPKLMQRISQLREEIRVARGLQERTVALQDEGFQVSRGNLARQEAQLAERMAALRGLAVAQATAARSVRARRAAELQAQRASAREVLERRDKQLARAEQGAKEGVLSEEQLTQVYADRLQVSATLATVTQESAQLRNEEVATRLQQEEIEGRIEALRVQKEALRVEALRIDREQEEAHGAASKQLVALEQQLAQVELELSLRRVDAPAEDDPLRGPRPAGATGAGKGLVVVIFMDASQAKRVVPGMEMRVVPDSVEVERFGAAVGRIDEVTTYPVTPAQAEVLLGNDALAQELARSGRAVVLIGKLEPAETPSGVRWTSSTGPRLSLTPGTTLNAHVTVERRRPIGFLLPFLRRLTGSDGA